MEPREHIERVHEAGKASHGDRFEKFGGVVVAVMAALLAFASVAEKRAITDLLLADNGIVDANNLAESNEIKQHVNEGAIAVLRALAASGAGDPQAHERAAALEHDIAATYRPAQEAQTERLHRIEHDRKRQEGRYEAFELAETVVQMGIVFATLAVLTRAHRLLWLSLALGALTVLLLLIGFAAPSGWPCRRL